MNNAITTTQKPTLYKRLGEEPGVRKIVSDVLDINSTNPIIAHHFSKTDMKKLKQLVFEFFSMGTGGPHQYTGRDMRTAHADMKINEKEWISASDDMLLALDKNGIGQDEKDEVMAILESFRRDIVVV